MNEKKECTKDIDNKLIIKNIEKFKILRQKKSLKLSNWDKYNDLVIVPVTINICINTFKYKIDFLKYSKYIVQILNDGFSGTIQTPYKNIDNSSNFLYNKNYIEKILEKNNISEINKNADIIYNYLNKKNDTKIRFYLHSVVYHDTFIEEKFENNNTEIFLENVAKKGFKILDKHYKNLNINIIKFNCSTLGVSIFPWMKYISKKISGCMQVFLDFCTIHPDIANNNFNRCRTLIHEVGHIFGLRHSFSYTSETLKVYEILLGKVLNKPDILNSINSINKENLSNSKSSNSDIIKEPIVEKDLTIIKNKLNHKEINFQLYPDIPIQQKATNYNPFEVNKFPFYNNIPCNFACFMDYSPDLVLTHFTDSQIKIMHYMIRMFKPYLIKKSKNENENYNNNFRIKLYIIKKNININIVLNKILEDTSSNKYYVIYSKKNIFKYSIASIDENLKKLIYIDKK
jgi:hypothetical protein